MHGDEYVAALGKLTMAGWRLEKAIHEVGRGLGMEDSATEAVARIDLALAAGNLPPWRAPAVTPDAIRTWLASAVACLADRDTYVTALSRGTTTPPYSVDDYTTLTVRCNALTQSGDDLSTDLAYVTASGTKLVGYHSIVRTLYTVLTDPEISPDIRPSVR